jgi:hypothetical protein
MERAITLGDILQKALERKEKTMFNGISMPDGYKVAAMVRAMLSAGRSYQSAFGTLNAPEMESLLRSAAKDTGEPPTVSLLLHRAHNPGITSLPGMFAGKPIDAIRMVRAATGAGLLESKRFIEGISPITVDEKAAFALRVLFGADNLLER